MLVTRTNREGGVEAEDVVVGKLDEVVVHAIVEEPPHDTVENICSRHQIDEEGVHAHPHKRQELNHPK